jgi:hypothetical protein
MKRRKQLRPEDEASYNYRLPAKQEPAFKVSFRCQFPEKEYASQR